MKVTIKSLSSTTSQLTINADAKDIFAIKEQVVKKMLPQVKLAGFRDGKVPPHLAEKQLDQNQLQTEVINEAVNRFYFDAIQKNKIRAVSTPKIELTKSIPFSDLEFIAEVESIGEIKLPDYKNVTIKKEPVKITKKDVNEVIERLRKQTAKYEEIKTAAKDGNQVWIDFEGKDEQNNPVKGAKSNNYPLIIGSNAFIPGFEDNIKGLKKDDTKKFTLTFPKDYQAKMLAGKKVAFEVKVLKIEKVMLDEVNDAFAKKLGKFETVDDLKKDVKKQIKLEKEHQAKHQLEEQIVKNIVVKTKVELPEKLLEEQMQALEKDFAQNLRYRDQTLKDYLEAKGIKPEEFKEKELKPGAIERLKTGLVLSEIAELENITVTPEEIEIRLQILKNQHKDPSMQTELEKPDAKREVASRLLTEKTIAKLSGFIK